MRIWSIHPKYLDTKGIVALWRETLLAKHVLEGKTKGYLNHPQLNRFKEHNEPLDAINYYLSIVFEEASIRGYNFNKDKFKKPRKIIPIFVNLGQMDYEYKHLQNKLKVRDKAKLKEIQQYKKIDPHPLFKVKKGEIEDWEIIAK